MHKMTWKNTKTGETGEWAYTGQDRIGDSADCSTGNEITICAMNNGPTPAIPQPTVALSNYTPAPSITWTIPEWRDTPGPGFYWLEGEQWPFRIYESAGTLFYYGRDGGCHRLILERFTGRKWWGPVDVPPVDFKLPNQT